MSKKYTTNRKDIEEYLLEDLRQRAFDKNDITDPDDEISEVKE